MAHRITCTDLDCTKRTKAWDLRDLLDSHRERGGVWFVCDCGKRGYVEKESPTQKRSKTEAGKPWKRLLWGAYTLGDDWPEYQPYVLLVSEDRDQPPSKLQFAYYRDMRPDGDLKAGYGPGGNPILEVPWIRDLLGKLDDLADFEGAER